MKKYFLPCPPEFASVMLLLSLTRKMRVKWSEWKPNWHDFKVNEEIKSDDKERKFKFCCEARCTEVKGRVFLSDRLLLKTYQWEFPRKEGKFIMIRWETAGDIRIQNTSLTEMGTNILLILTARTLLSQPIKHLEMFFGCLYFFLSKITSKSTNRKRRERFEKRSSLASQWQCWSELAGETGMQWGAEETATLHQAHVHYDMCWRERAWETRAVQAELGPAR